MLLPLWHCVPSSTNIFWTQRPLVFPSWGSGIGCLGPLVMQHLSTVIPKVMPFHKASIVPTQTQMLLQRRDDHEMPVWDVTHCCSQAAHTVLVETCTSAPASLPCCVVYCCLWCTLWWPPYGSCHRPAKDPTRHCQPLCLGQTTRNNARDDARTISYPSFWCLRDLWHSLGERQPVGWAGMQQVVLSRPPRPGLRLTPSEHYHHRDKDLSGCLLSRHMVTVSQPQVIAYSFQSFASAPPPMWEMLPWSWSAA